MPASFKTLANDDIRPGPFRRDCCPDRTDLIQHESPSALGAHDNMLVNIPKETDRMNALFKADCQLLFKQRSVGGCGYEVRAERLIGSLSDGIDLSRYHLRLFPNHAKKAVTTGVRYGRHQFRSRHTTHARLQDGISAAKEITQRRVQNRFGSH